MIIVLVVASTTALTGGDALIRARLEAAGHTVVLRNDDDAEYTGSYDGVVIGDSSVNATVASKYNTVAKPGLCTEAMTSGWRLGSSITGVDGTQWTVTNNLPAARGSVAAGTRTIYTATTSQQGITPAGTHTVIAYRGAGSSSNPVYVVWESGAALSSGTAPAKRALLRLANSAGNAATAGGTVAADGVALLDAAIAWTFAPVGIAPTVDVGEDVASWTIGVEFTRLATVTDGGLTTTTAWTIQAGPAGVGSTIETDADLAWIPTTLGTYTLRATSANSVGSDFDDMSITVVEASEIRRMYMTSHSSDKTAFPAAASFWSVATGPPLTDVHQLSNAPEGPSEFRNTTETSSLNPANILMGRWLSGPAESAGDIVSDIFTFCMARGEWSLDANFVWSLGVRVVTPTNTIRGEVIDTSFTLEWPLIADEAECVAINGVVQPEDVLATEVQIGDRLLIEIGYRATNALTTPQTGTIIFGGTDTPDLVAGDTGVELGRPPWAEFPVSPGLTFAEVSEPAPPSGTPGQIADLSQWHLTLPTDSGDGDAAQIDQPELETYTDEHFFTDSEGRIVFVAPIEGFTTSGASGATRSELRQRDPNYDLTAFNPHTATQRMTATTYVDATSIEPDPPGRKEMIIWQIHGDSGSPPLLLAAEYHVATPRVRIFKDGPGVSNPILNLTPTTPVTVRCVIGGGQLDLWVVAGQVGDIPSTPTATWATSEFVDDIDWYFKIGAYNKTEIGSGASGGEAIAKVSYLELNNDVLLGGDAPADAFPQMAFFFGGM